MGFWGFGVPAKAFAVAYEMTAEEFQELKSIGADKEEDKLDEE